MILLVPVAIILIWGFGYIYDTKGRYNSISNNQILKLNENLGIAIAWIVLLISFASPFIILLLDIK